MLWIRNYLKTGFGTFCLVFVPALLFCFFLGTSNVFADSVLSHTATTTDTFYICDDDNSSRSPYKCSDFSFIKIISTGTSITNGSTGPVINGSLYGGLGAFNPIYISLSSSTSVRVNNYQGSAYLPSGWEISYYLISDLIESTCPSSPSGTLNITENGTYDVSTYAEAVVDIPPEIQYGDYHDDLMSIKQSIYTCGAICLVLYFFYCIYRMIIKSTGGF